MIVVSQVHKSETILLPLLLGKVSREMTRQKQINVFHNNDKKTVLRVVVANKHVVVVIVAVYNDMSSRRFFLLFELNSPIESRYVFVSFFISLCYSFLFYCSMIVYVLSCTLVFSTVRW
jgi:hypothetical protein